MNQGSLHIESCAINRSNLFDSLIQDYVYHPDKLAEFIRYEGSIEGVLTAAQDKKYENRKGLVEEINRQYNGLKLSEAVSNNIQLFAKENTFCVVTAHQLSLLGGPLYYAHKILSVIKLCQKAQEQDNRFNFVPVFVLGSEDHDFEEVNHVFYNQKQYRWHTNQGGAIGRFKWDAAAQDMLENLCAELKDKNLANKIQSIYQVGEQYSSIQRRLIHLLFESYGLVIIDLDTSFFKQKSAAIFQDEIAHGRASQVLKNNLEKLSTAYNVQAQPRPINIFELSEDKRTYVEKNNHPVLPENLSPNVIYRPLMQQFCLPAVCYTGGGGELAYWLELKPLFEYYQVAYPVLCLRNHIVYAEEKTYHKLKQWHFKSETVFEQKDKIIQDWILQHERFSAAFELSKIKLTEVFNPLQNEANSFDQSLKGAIAAERHHVEEILDKLEKKFVKASKRKNEDLLAFVDKWKDQLFPNGVLMERHHSLIEQYDRYGNSWFDRVLKEIEPFSKEILFLYN